MTHDICSHGRPNHQDLITELRFAAGLPNYAMAKTPQNVWYETLQYVEELAHRMRSLDK